MLARLEELEDELVQDCIRQHVRELEPFPDDRLHLVDQDDLRKEYRGRRVRLAFDNPSSAPKS